MSKFTILVNDEVSVAPLAKMLVDNGYRLRSLPHQNVVELTETEERRAEIIAAHAGSERMRREFLERGWEP